MTHPALIERITRSLAYMLRHQPDEFDLEVDDHGYAELSEVVRALNERLDESVSEDDVREATEAGDRQRYEIAGDRIRALYGHSIDVLPGEPARPPERLYVGVSRADADRARRYGLRPGRRRFLHLALTPEDALETAQRTAREHEVIVVRALDAWEDGVNFYDRIALFLSDPIPTQYLEGSARVAGRGAPVARPSPVRHAREEVVYARPEHDEGEALEELHLEDAPLESGHARSPEAPAADGPGRGRRRGRRGRRRSEGGAPPEAFAPAAHGDDPSEDFEAPAVEDFDEAPPAGGFREPAAREAARRAPAPYRDEPRRDAPPREAPRREAPRHEAPRHEAPRHEAPRRDLPRRDSPQGEAPYRDAPYREERAPRSGRARDDRPAEPRPAERAFGTDRPSPRSEERVRDERTGGRGPDDRPRREERPRYEGGSRPEGGARYGDAPRHAGGSRPNDAPRHEASAPRYEGFAPRHEGAARPDEAARHREAPRGARADDRNPRRDDASPRREDRPRGEDRGPRDDRPRRDERPRGEDRPHGDRPHGDRSRAGAFGGRPAESAHPEPRRDEIPRPPPDVPRRPEAEAAGGFGLGVVDDSAARPARPARPASAPIPPRPAPVREERAPERAAPPDDGGGFGAGIL